MAPAALFSRRNGDLLPVLQAFFRPVSGELQDRSLCLDWLNPGDPELHGFLHNPVHFVGDRKRLYEGDGQRRFALADDSSLQTNPGLRRQFDEFAFVFEALSIKNCHGLTVTQTQHTHGVMSGSGGQREITGLGR